MPQTLVLASTSPFRKQLLEKLHLSFLTEKPAVDETPLDGETAQQLVQRLAIEKAQAISPNFENALVIGSDQVCMNNGEILGKPGNFENAFKQLKAASGKRITFYTGLAVVNSQNNSVQSLVEPYIVKFRQLSDEMITNYLNKEQPYNCAGSFKSEGYGISLFEAFEGKDPNSLIGLPLISLIEMLENEGMQVV
ncbi:septum formation inhibitor Maf [Psychromonas sp. psych-6C06]|uniref:Maf family protein n=1 Tax=Psychromonas sp. psych-6C06 TaxID=2058089 RepID=UPI000C31D32F|nr:nucleoside triphosphate pyrophosphatase [Psychromonas sp. psych-6C06]PKF62611.1 septum formation inhibitor Maf [Psychromonas sp. psych-6C06]